MRKIGVVGYFFEFYVIMTSLWRHFSHVDVIFIILWNFTTKILKPSILIAWKWLIPLFNIFLGGKSEFVAIFYIDVIMTSFDVTFAILMSFSLNAWNACYINSYLFLTIVGCEKSELLVIFIIWRHYDVFMTSFLPCWRNLLSFYGILQPKS